MTHPLSAETETAARTQAGRDALELLHLYGEGTAADVIRGRLCAYVMAHAAVSGWADVRHIIEELYADTHIVWPESNLAHVEGHA